jgi:DNA-binding response OmpR family regulator
MPPPLIAIIDEDAAFRSLLNDLLQDEGYRTLLNASTCEGYISVSLVKPDLVILDLWIERPEAGWHLILDLRSDAATASVPILVCSSDVNSLVRHEYLLGEWGCGVLPKPFDVSHLLCLVKDLTESGRR